MPRTSVGQLPPDLAAKCLALHEPREGGPVLPGHPPAEREGRKKKQRAELVAPSFDPAGPAWVVPVVVPSLANGREWQVRNRTAKAHRDAVSRALGPHLRYVVRFAEAYHAGRAVRCHLTRLGGRKLDRGVNLPGSLKYVEDAVALIIGADDGDERWECTFGQEPGGPVGVRIELSEGG